MGHDDRNGPGLLVQETQGSQPTSTQVSHCRLRLVADQWVIYNRSEGFRGLSIGLTSKWMLSSASLVGILFRSIYLYSWQLTKVGRPFLATEYPALQLGL